MIFNLLKVSLFFTVFTTLLHGVEWKVEKKIELKKDEIQYVKINSANSEKIFFFRWTLYHNKGLVLLKTYDENVSQNMLYLSYKNQNVIVKIKDVPVKHGVKPYLLLKFTSFDYKKKTAKFTLFLRDATDQVGLEFIKKTKYKI